MEPTTQDLSLSAALMFMVDPTAALKAAERAAASGGTRRRHSIILGRLINDHEARHLDRQRAKEQQEEEAAMLHWADTDFGPSH